VNAVLILINLLLYAGWQFDYRAIGAQLDMHNNRCLAAWYQSAVFLLVGIAALLYLMTQRRAGRLSGVERWGWPPFMALIFCIAANEMALLHKDIGQASNAHYGQLLFGRDGHLPVLLAPLALVLLAFLTYFTARVLWQTPLTRLLTLGTLVCWSMAVGGEFLEWLMFHEARLFSVIEHPLEESLATIGATLLLTAVLELSFLSAKSRHAAGASPGAAGGEEPH
jgi:hypothetical protein